jgi:hypothetical protein
MRKQVKSESAVMEPVECVDSKRREAIRQLGRYAGYTAPMLLALMTSEAAAQRSGA